MIYSQIGILYFDENKGPQPKYFKIDKYQKF